MAPARFDDAFFNDRITGQRRVKRRYLWAVSGFCMGVAAGCLLVVLL